jgi:hypothetical protein
LQLIVGVGTTLPLCLVVATIVFQQFHTRLWPLLVGLVDPRGMLRVRVVIVVSRRRYSLVGTAFFEYCMDCIARLELETTNQLQADYCNQSFLFLFLVLG